MIKPAIPSNEAERLHALRTLNILDTSHEERFDRVTRMAKRMFNVSISLVSLIDEDRQWFKSKQGLEASETPIFHFADTLSTKTVCSSYRTLLRMNDSMTTHLSQMLPTYVFMQAIP